MKPLNERHYIRLRGKLIELTDKEYSERQKRIAKMRQQFEREREADEKKEQSVTKKDYYAKGLDRLADYMRTHK